MTEEQIKYLEDGKAQLSVAIDAELDSFGLSVFDKILSRAITDYFVDQISLTVTNLTKKMGLLDNWRKASVASSSAIAVAMKMVESQMKDMQERGLL